jgi:hypothetical protein
VDGSQLGIALLLGGSAAVVTLRAAVVTFVALNQIFHWV